MSTTASSVGSARGRGAARMWLLALLVLAVVVGVVLSTRAEPAPPFSVGSTAPEGYGALALLLRERGASVDEVPASVLDAGADDPAAGPGDAVVVPVPSTLDDARRRRLGELADAGATVVLGEPPRGEGGTDALETLSFLTGRTLIDTPAMPVATGDCDIAELADLGPVDAAFATGVVTATAEGRCYDEGGGALFLERGTGTGRVITLASPLLWSNARLQPAKEEGGEPLANGATAIRLLGDRQRVVVVDPDPGTGAAPDGTQDPISLLPLPVKLALVQLVAAFVLFVWWRSRRLGRPVRERLPVEIAGSELVVAVGDLLRRRGDTARAAATVRADTRRTLLQRLGLAPDTAPGTLVAVVAARTGRPPEEVAAALLDDAGAPVPDAAALVRLVQTLDSIRKETLDVPSPL